MRTFIIVSLAFAGVRVSAFEFKCSFAKGGWNNADWIMVKSPRWDHFGGWVQKNGCIENEAPAGSESCRDTYTSMVLKRKFKGNVVVSAEMEFTNRMAPLIVIAPELGKSAKGVPEYREHFEIVLFDKGINVWHHYFKDGKPSCKRAAFCRFTLKANKKHTLKVEVKPTPKGKMLIVSVAGHEFGYIDDSLPDSFHVGITGCEGVNKFHNFKVFGEAAE